MRKLKKVYPYSLTEAMEKGEIELCRKNRQLNKECLVAIEQAVKESNYSVNFYDLKTAVKTVVGEYGINRVCWVLAKTVQRSPWDGRYIQNNKDWAITFSIPDDSVGYSKVHPTILNDMIKYAREIKDTKKQAKQGKEIAV